MNLSTVMGYKWSVVCILVLAANTALYAKEPPMTYELRYPAAVESGSEFEVRVVISVSSPWYLYAPTGTNKLLGMVETEVEFYAIDEVQIAEPEYPSSRKKGHHDVLDGDNVIITVPMRIRPRVAPNVYDVSGVLRYQVCKDSLCLPPTEDRVNLRISVT